MSAGKKKLPLPQAPDADHAAQVMRQKLGDLRALTIAPAPGTQTLIESPSGQKALEEKIIAALQTIFDPEIPLNIYDLGLIYRISIAPSNAVKVEMTLTAPGCPVAGEIVAEVQRKIESLPEVPSTRVELVWDPPWTRERLSEAARLELGLM